MTTEIPDHFFRSVGPECGTQFYARADAKFCSSRCRQRAYLPAQEGGQVTATATRRKRAPARKPTALSDPDSAKGRLQRAVRKILVEQHQATGMLPTSARFVWYEAETEGLVTKELPPKRPDAQGQRKPGQNLTDAILHLREIGPERGGSRGAGSPMRPARCTASIPRPPSPST